MTCNMGSSVHPFRRPHNGTTSPAHLGHGVWLFTLVTRTESRNGR
jgi:hypothetical protein